MKGIILAGGSGSRLSPLTNAVNKHLLPVGEQPMIYHPIKKMVGAGITDIMIVTGTEHIGSVVRCLGSGHEFECEFTYKVQDTAGGIAQALGLCRNFCYGEHICVILGDNIFQDSLVPFVQDYKIHDRGARIILQEVSDLERYGTAFINKDRKLIDIVEKPSVELLYKRDEIGMAVTGIYFYDQRVFDIIETLKPSKRGELEITDVNNEYLSWGNLDYSVMNGFWTDAGEHSSLRTANRLIMENPNEYDIL